MALSKAMNFFGQELIDNILKDYRALGFPYQNTLPSSMTWESNKLFAPIYFNTLVKGEGRKPGKYAPVDVINQWVRLKPARRFRDLKTGRFISRRQQAFLINRAMKEKGNQVYQNKRMGIDMEKTVNDALDKSIGKFGDEIIENF